MNVNQKYLLHGQTQDGYYVEIIMLILAGSFTGSFKVRIDKHGLSLYQNNDILMFNIQITGFDRFYVDPSQIDRELVIDSTKKNNQLSNNKKRDMATMFITRDKPNVLVLQIRDSTNSTCMDILYPIKNVEDDLPSYIVPDLKHEDPTIIIESGEMTKAVKIITKASAKNVMILSQPEAIRLVSIDETNVNEVAVDIGRWNPLNPVQTHIVSKDAFKSVMKFYNLGKKLRIHIKDDIYCMSLYLPGGLGYGTIVFNTIKQNE